jgi:hypothetical protein
MKKILILITALLITFSLSGCGEEEHKDVSMFVDMYNAGIIMDENYDIPEEEQLVIGEGTFVVKDENEMMIAYFGEEVIIVIDFYFQELNAGYEYTFESIGYLRSDFTYSHYVEMEGYWLNDFDEAVTIDMTPDEFADYVETFTEDDFKYLIEELGLEE